MKMQPLLLLLLCSFSLTLAATDHAHNDSLSLPPRSYQFHITANEANTSYLVNFNVTTAGRETVPVRANLDTGSDLTWLFGWTCMHYNCYCDRAACIQDPIKSAVGACGACNDLPDTAPHRCRCRGPEEICWFKMGYEGRFRTGGMLTRGIFWFNSKQFSDVWFGLVNISEGQFKNDSAGLVGLGRGKLSFISQLGIPIKFSYCLFDPSHPSASSKLLMGEKVEINEQHSTPLLYEGCDSSHYCVHFKSIYLNDNQVYDEGGDSMIIDSGSTFTRLKKKIFKKIIEEVNKIMGGSEPKELIDGKYKYDHCYKDNKENTKQLDSVSFKIEDKWSLNLKRVNFFDKIYDHDDGRKEYLCLTVKEFEGANVLGSRAQIDFEVAISIPDNKVSFTEKNCIGKQSNINEEERLAFQE